jgi:cell division protein FtsL
MTRSVRKFKETIEMRALPFKRLQSHRYFPAAIIALVVLTAACVHVWQRVVVMSLVHEVALLQKDSRELVDNIEKVQSEIAALSMGTRIEQFAQDSLGLQRVTPTQLYTLEREEEKEEKTEDSDELTVMLSSIKRVADYLPALTQAQAQVTELQPIRFDTDTAGMTEP